MPAASVFDLGYSPMIANVFLALVQNAALLLAVAFVYDLTTSRYRLGPGLLVQVAIGVMLGIFGCVLILSPWIYVPGIIFDTRSVLLGITGLFFGLVPTAAAMAITATFRLTLGGEAAWVGVAVILATGAIGIVWHRYRRQGLDEISWRELYLFGVLIHAVMLALMFILPRETALQVLARISLPVLLIYPLATSLLGMLMVNRLRRERDAEKLLVSQERMRLFFERQIVGMAIISAEKRWLQVNDEFCRMVGYSREELSGFTWTDFTHPDDLQVDSARFEQLLSGAIDEYSMEKRFLRKDGSFIWTELSVGCVRCADGTVDCVLALLVDISERKRTEEALQMFRVLVENASDAIGMSTPEGRHFYQNEAFTALFGEIGEEPPATLYVEKAVGKEVFRTVMAGERWDGEVKMYARDRRVLSIFLRAYPNRDSTGRIVGLVGIHTDISERKRTEEEKERLQKQLLQAQKMESIGRLAGGVAHDFNNMLQTIMGYCDLSLRSLEPTSPLRENLQEISRAATRSADLTRQLLAFARQQTVVPKVLDLNDTVVGMLNMLQRLIGENIDLAWLPGHNLWKVKIDPSQLDQILANFAINARDAIGDTGRITIETENVRLDEAQCAGRPDCLPGDYVLLAVSDNGCGMDKETMGQVFEPFFTTKEQGKGTGLGLATVYGTVRQSNGFVSVYSEPGQGATFKIYLPRFADTTGPAAEDSRQEEPAGGTETVLLVEDEAAILNLGAMILGQLGYTVLTAGMPAEALRLAQEHPGDIHLLITDVVMPEMNGRELARQLSLGRPQMKCLYMSGYTADVIAHHGVLDAGIHFIQKPFSLNNMARAVRGALENAQVGTKPHGS